MPTDVQKELQEKRVELANEIRSLADQQDNWTDEQRARYDAVNEEYDATIEKLEAIAEREKVLERRAKIEEDEQRLQSARRSTVSEARIVRAGITGHQQRALALQAWLLKANDRELRAEHEQACHECRVNPASQKIDIRTHPFHRSTGFEMWDSQGRPIANSFNEWRKEQRNLSVGTDAAGGFTVPEDFSFELERNLLAYGGPRRVCRIHVTASGSKMPWPVADDTSNKGEIVAEEGTIGSSVDPTFSQVSFSAYKYSSKPILVSAELLEDSAFNMAILLAEMLGERIGRIQCDHFTSGTGTGQPQGIVTGSAQGVAAASATAIDSDELIDLQDSLDPAYESLPSVGWIMNKSTKTAVRKLKDANSQYLWQPGLRFGDVDLLLGRPITINQSMDAIATAKKPILYGAFEKYVIRDAASLRFYRLEELYRANDMTGFVAFRRSDAKMLNANAIKHLVMAVGDGVQGYQYGGTRETISRAVRGGV